MDSIPPRQPPPQPQQHATSFAGQPHLLDPQLHPASAHQLYLQQQHPSASAPSGMHHQQQLAHQHIYQQQQQHQRPFSPPSPFAFAPPPISGVDVGAGGPDSMHHHHHPQHQLAASSSLLAYPHPTAEDNLGHETYALPLTHAPALADGEQHQQQAGRGRPRSRSSSTSSRDAEEGAGEAAAGEAGEVQSQSASPSHTSTANAGSANGNRGEGGPSSTSAAGGSVPRGASSSSRKPARTSIGGGGGGKPSTAQARPHVKVAPGPRENLTSIAAIRSYPTGEDEDRPFQCDLCPQNFNRNHDLKRHRKIHLELKPFSCVKCDKHFSRKDALRRHWLVKGCKGGDVAGAGIPSDPAFLETRPSTSGAAGQSTSSKSSSVPPTTAGGDPPASGSSSSRPAPKRTGSIRGGTGRSKKGAGAKGKKGKEAVGRDRPLKQTKEEEGSGRDGEAEEDPDTSAAGPSSYSSASSNMQYNKMQVPQSFTGHGPLLSPPASDALHLGNGHGGQGDGNGLPPPRTSPYGQQNMRDLSPMHASGLPAFPSPPANGPYGPYHHPQQQQHHPLQPQTQHHHFQQQQHPHAQFHSYQLPYPQHLGPPESGYGSSSSDPHSVRAGGEAQHLGPTHGAGPMQSPGGYPASYPFGLGSGGGNPYPRGFFPPAPPLGLAQVQQHAPHMQQAPDEVVAWPAATGGAPYPAMLPDSSGHGSDGPGPDDLAYHGGGGGGPPAFGGMQQPPALSSAVPNGLASLPMSSPGNQHSLVYSPYRNNLPQPLPPPPPPQQHQAQSSPSSLHPSPAGSRPRSPGQLLHHGPGPSSAPATMPMPLVQHQQHHPHHPQQQHIQHSHHPSLDGGQYYSGMLHPQQQQHRFQPPHQQHEWYAPAGGHPLGPPPPPQQQPLRSNGSGSYEHDPGRFQ